MSASESDAAITTAASVGWGRSRNRPGTNRSMAAIRIAPTRPVTCVLAPACSATAVRDPLVLTGKPWNSPAPRLAAPIPIISWLPSTSSPDAVGERGRGRDRVGQRDQRDPERTADQRREVGAVHVRDGERREALRGACRRARRRAARGRTRGRDDRARSPQPARSAPGARSLRTMITARPSTPTASAAPTVSPSRRPSTNAAVSSMRPFASVEKPNSFGSWPTRMVTASPFM